MAEKFEKLFDQFAPVTPEEWRAKAEVDLKGADYSKKMIWRTNEGFNVEPIYRGVDIENLKTTESLPGEYPFVRGTRVSNDWYVRQDIDVTDVKAANAKALEILNKGINDVCFKLPHGQNVDLAALLDKIDVNLVAIDINCCPKVAADVAKQLVAIIEKQGAQETFVGSINFDPFKRYFKHGEPFPGNMVEMAKQMLDIVKPVKNLRVLSVDAIMLNNAGAFIYQELGYALAWGNEWLAMLTEAGVPAQEVATRIKFNMGISTVYFMEIAKFRAARMLWAQIVKQYNPECDCACKMVVNAATTEFTQTVFDSYVNLLRSQTQAMSAALAGVDSIVVAPFDKAYQTPDDFSERIARNQQILLKEESHLDKVVDPAGGSYYVEMLTMSIAQEGWKLFLDVEDKGGFKAVQEAGEITAAVNASAKARFDKVAKRREQLLGTNQFPNFTEKSEGKRAAGNGCCCAAEEAPFKAISSTRLAADFEDLRIHTEEVKVPTAFMLTIGNLAMRQARAQFSCNFLACAGYKVIDNLGFKTVEEGVDAALKADADIVVICSSDDEYAEYAIPAFKYLDGRAMFVVAGAPACMDDLKAAGIENYIHVKCNVLETLKEYNAKLGI